LFENTIEGVIYDILNKKKQIIRTVMGDEIQESGGDIAEEILKLINKR
jgi:SNF2 family DNA or RNA helicase